MTTRWMLAWTMAAGLAASSPALAQFARPGVPSCPGDTPMQLDARAAALQATRQITRAARQYKMLHSVYPSWQELAESHPGASRDDLDLKWGAPEPLAGWRIHYVSDGTAFVFTLTGVRDKCRVTFVSDEGGNVLDGREVGPSYGVVPLGTR